MIKYETERVLVRDLKILEIWREYYQKPTNEGNLREGRNDQQTEVEDAITKITNAEIEIAPTKHKVWGSYWTCQLTGRSVEEFGKNCSELSEGSIEQDH